MAFIATIKDLQNSIKTEKFTPYIATIGPTSVKPDYDKLKEAGVSAMMFNAGGLYDHPHIPRKYYKNSHLDSQVKACLEAKLPFALYADVRAKSKAEADAECKALYYILAEHSPQLGIWLHMDTPSTVKLATNDIIIDVYYRYITEWGLKGRCGIYIDKSFLSKFSWTNYQEDFYLWMIDKVTSFKNIDDKLLMPSMFEVPD